MNRKKLLINEAEPAVIHGERTIIIDNHVARKQEYEISDFQQRQQISSHGRWKVLAHPRGDS